VGDSRRFNLFADLIVERFPALHSSAIADVAAGKGYLKAALYLRGFRNVTSWDRRQRLAKPRPGQRYGLFDYRTAPPEYRLVVGMHPDRNRPDCGVRSEEASAVRDLSVLCDSCDDGVPRCTGRVRAVGGTLGGSGARGAFPD